MKRAIATTVAVSSVVVLLIACTRTVERVMVVTATPAPASPTATSATPSPTSQPNLSMEEAVGLIQQRETTQLTLAGPEETTWKNADFLACLLAVAPDEYGAFLESLGQPGVIVPGGLRNTLWLATLERPGRWKVDLLCLLDEGPPVNAATWTVDDESLRVIPVAGLAD